MRLCSTCKFVTFLWIVNLASSVERLKEKFAWKQIDFNYTDEAARQNAIKNGDFIPENNLPVGIERWKDKLFVSVPRWKAGIPSTLNYISLDDTSGKSPSLEPYPSLEENKLGDCENGLNTVYRIKVDKCDRLWVLDTGTFGIDETTTNPCPYTINVFDLNTDKRIRRYAFRPEDTNPKTFIANTVVDVGDSCDDAFAYFSDELGYGLIVYSWEQNKSWRFMNDFFHPDPARGDFFIGGLNFKWSDEGIFGMALSPVRDNGYKDLYFSPLASHKEYVISTKSLKNESYVSSHSNEVRVLEERGINSHVTAKVMNDEGIMLFNLIDQNAIGCWNSELKYSPTNHGIVEKDDVGLIFPSDVKIDSDSNVWVISDKMPVFLESTLNRKEDNFRIYTAPLKDLIKGTICDKQATVANVLGNRQAETDESFLPEIPEIPEELEPKPNPSTPIKNQRPPIPNQPPPITNQPPLITSLLGPNSPAAEPAKEQTPVPTNNKPPQDNNWHDHHNDWHHWPDYHHPGHWHDHPHSHEEHDSHCGHDHEHEHHGWHGHHDHEYEHHDPHWRPHY